MSTTRRHLTLDEALEALGRGRQVEQFLGRDDEDGPTVVRVAIASPATRHEPARAAMYRIDATNTDMVDLTAAWPIVEEDDDEAHAGIAGSPDDVLQAAQPWGAEPGRWVNSGMAGTGFQEWLAQRPRRGGTTLADLVPLRPPGVSLADLERAEAELGFDCLPTSGTS